MKTQTEQLLTQYCPTNAAEIRYREEMLAFIHNHADAFCRSCKAGHFTGSAWLLNRDESKALLMHHRKLDRWFQLGGHCDGDSDVLAVAVKEAQEESGIEDIIPVSGNIFDLDIHTIPANKQDPEHLHLDIRFLLKVNSSESITKNSESKDLRWFGKNDPFPTDNPSVVRMRDKWSSW